MLGLNLSLSPWLFRQPTDHVFPYVYENLCWINLMLPGKVLPPFFPSLHLTYLHEDRLRLAIKQRILKKKLKEEKKSKKDSRMKIEGIASRFLIFQ